MLPVLSVVFNVSFRSKYRYWRKLFDIIFKTNVNIKRALGVVGFNSRLELENLSTAEDAEGLVPDGVTQQTFRNGKCMIWDYTCHDTYTDIYLNVNKWSGQKAGTVAEEAEKR